MTRDEVTAVLGVLRVAYPRFYMNITKEDAMQTINLWSEMFAEDDAKLVTMAVKSLINSFQYPPAISDVKDHMYKMTSKEVDNMELWNELDRAVRNCLYKEKEVFEGLSPLVKRFIGSPAQLRELAVSDATTFSTVTKGQFLKQIEVLKKREKDSNMMLPQVRKFIFGLESNNNQKQLN